MKKLFGLKIGDNIKANGVILPINMFEKDKNNCWWAHLGNIDYLLDFGYYGERSWLISTPNDICWKRSKWKKIEKL